MTRPGGMGDEKCSRKELKISFRHREIASISGFCSFPFIEWYYFPTSWFHLSLSATPGSQASLVALLWENHLRHRFFSSLSPYPYHIYKCGLMPIHLLPSIHYVPESGLQLPKHCVCALLPRLLLLLAPQRPVLHPWAFQHGLSRHQGALRQLPQLVLHCRGCSKRRSWVKQYPSERAVCCMFN